MEAEKYTREAKQFNENGMLYIHAEKTRNDPTKLIISGDTREIMSCVYNILCHVSMIGEVKLTALCRDLLKCARQTGIPDGMKYYD